MGTYLTIYLLLIILTILTFAVSYAGLPGNLSFAAAMAVALLKSTLVAGWFMHLKYDNRFNLMVFLSAFWFMAVFFGFTLTDLGSRDAILQQSGNFAARAEQGSKYAQPAELLPGALEEEGGGEGEHH